jgi:hypothetical protein
MAMSMSGGLVEWLRSLELEEYTEAFEAAGYTGLRFVREMMMRCDAMRCRDIFVLCHTTVLARHRAVGWESVLWAGGFALGCLVVL